MYVCVCNSVTDTDIRKLVHTHGITTVSELGEHLGVARQCGKCANCARCVLRDARREARAEAACANLMAA